MNQDVKTVMLSKEDKDIYYMTKALELAKIAYDNEEVPVGVVIVKDDKIISSAYNMKNKSKIATHHAEILAINEACKNLNVWVLEGCTMYVTLEPCLMCAGAIINSRITRLVYATNEPKFGACQSLINLFDIPKLNHRVEVTSNILFNESSNLLKQFFKGIRKNKK